MLGASVNGAMRVMKAMPMPDRPNARGSRAGSAPGASLRTARWATTKAAKMPMGTLSESTLTCWPSLMAIMTNSSATTGAATSRRTSSMLRRDMMCYLCVPVAVCEATAGAFAAASLVVAVAFACVDAACSEPSGLLR